MFVECQLITMNNQGDHEQERQVRDVVRTVGVRVRDRGPGC